MINLELTDSYKQTTIDINKYNHIVLCNYEGYISFYNYFYELIAKKNKEYGIRLSNKTLDSKNAIMFDFTSIANIFVSLEYKKGTLLYEYMISKYTYIDSIGYERMFELYMDIKNNLNDNDEGVFYDIVQDLNKILYEGIELSYKKEDIIDVIKKILYQFLENNYSKTVIVFLNSDIFTLDFDLYENVYCFDIGRMIDTKKYNLIANSQVDELEQDIIFEYIKDNYPLVVVDIKIQKCIDYYLKFYIYHSKFDAYSEEDLIIYALLSKKMNKTHEIVPNNFIISDKIKSYLAQL